jgi:predicted DNA-binding transcriptional regulator YafY
MKEPLKKAIRLLKLIDLLQHPGKTKENLSKLVNKDVRTIERDLIELKEIGFENDKDEAGRYFIFPDSLSGAKVYLTSGEADFLSDLINHTQSDHPLTQSIQSKLIFRTGLGKWLSDEVKKNVPKTIHQLTDAMKMNCQIEILNYYSAYRGEYISRIVEPLEFTTNYRYLIAYEANDDLYVNIKIDRITEMNILEDKCSKSPNDVALDIFQMAFNQEKHAISLLLTPLAYRILIEERPGADDLITPCDEGQFKFRFETEIATFLPISRFCMGLPGQIKVEKSVELIGFLKKRKEQFLW